MIFIASRYGVAFGSFQTGCCSYCLSAGVTYPIDAETQGLTCSGSIMKRRNSLAAFGYFVYLKIIWLKNRLNSVGLPTGPTGKFAWKMSASRSLTFGSVAFFAAK